MQVSEIMSHETVTVAPDTPIAKVAELMRDKGIGFVPVGENDKLVGTITDRDLVTRFLANGEDPSRANGEDPSRAKAGDVMTDDLLYCRTSDQIEDVAANMGNQQIRRLPVVDDDKRLVGVVSLGDLAEKDADSSGDALQQVSH